MPSKYVTVAGTATNYFHTGPTTLPPEPPRLDRGLVLLFLHGAGSNAHAWHGQLEHFGLSHSGLAFDFPAHGRSGRTEGLRTVDAWRDFTAAFASALGLPPSVLIGHDMGAAAALSLAAALPERWRGLVLINAAARAPITAERIETWRDVMRGRKPQPFTADDFAPGTDFSVMRNVWTEQVKTDPRVRYQDYAAWKEFDAETRIGGIRVPTLIVAGGADRFTPPDGAQRLGQGIPGSRVVIVEGAGHELPAEKPAELNAAIEEFVCGLPG